MYITSTTGVAAPERIEYWESWNQASLVGLRCSTPVPDRFNALAQQTELGNITVTRIQAAQHVIDRNTQSIDAVPKHSVFFSVLLRGSAFIYHEEGLRILHPGDTLQYSTMHPYLLGFDQEMELLILDVDADIAIDTWGKSVGAIPTIGAPTAISRRLTSTALELLAEPDYIQHGEAAAFTTPLARLTRDAMGGQASNQSLLEIALHLIEKHLHEPQFDSTIMSQLLHVSDRQLRRIFSSHEEGPGAAILSARLREAKTRLASDLSSTISDIAYACGFGSPSAFSRAFKSKFGTSPSDARGL